MTAFHPEYGEYVTCSKCGLKKYCKYNGKITICYACDHGNFPKFKNTNAHR